MTTTLVTGIGELVTFDDTLEGAELAEGLGLLRDAAVVVDDGRVGLDRAGVAARRTPTSGVDLGGRAVIPGFVDSHTHLVFAGDRAAEFAARMAGHAVRRRWHRHLGRGDPGGDRRRSCAPCSRRGSARCGRRAPPRSRSRAATG